MKKFLSCVLAMALVFSLMSMTVWASEPNLADNQVITNAEDNKQYNVIGNGASGDSTENGTYTDGVTDFGNKTIGADVGVSFSSQTNSGDGSGDAGEGGSGSGNTVTNNIIEHRYAMDIVYTDLIINLSELTQGESTEVTDPETGEVISTTTVTYQYVWNVNKHTYDLVKTTTVTDENGKVVGQPTEEVVPDTGTMDDTPVVLEGAFQIINHSDLPVYYSATVEVNSDKGYDDVLKLAIDAAATDADPHNKVNSNVNACVATYANGSWSEADAQPGTAHAIYATPKNDWSETIGALAGNNNANAVDAVVEKVGSISITVSKNALN